MGCSPSSRKGIYGYGTKKLRAALLIQKWYRRYRANLEIRRRCTWNIFQSIEYAGEQDQLKLHNFFNKMLLNMSTEGDGQAPLINAFNVNKRASIYDTQTITDTGGEVFYNFLDDIKVESSYKGIHLKFPLTLSQLHKMVQAFRRKLTLHAKYTIQLLLETRKLLKTQANIRYATTSISKQITICGDLHGKLSDLYMVFHKNGLPAVDNPYIFNGDFVDRGHFSTEVALVLFSCFIMNPNEVYINRGNHEDHVMNIRYGFVKEIERKYRHSKKIIHLFKDVFSWLPLATVVDEQVLVCHGGISDTTDLKLLSTIDRHRYMSTLQPPGGCDDISTMAQEDLIEWKQVLDLLWSDPYMKEGCQPNTFRGGGVYFGSDVTTRFLEENKLKLLIRSHECKPDGYEYTHDGKVLTVFSASSYYETGSNLGAFVRLQGPNMHCHIVQYLSTHSPVLRKVSFTQRINLVEKSALSDLKERLLASRSELMNEFKKYDTDMTGKISSADWCFAMETVLEMELPWRILKTKLAKTDDDGNVFYESSFEKLQVKHRYSGNGPSITETLYKHKDSLETIFRMIDTDHSGQISMPEFEDALSILIKQLDLAIKETEIRDIAQSIDMNKDGYIDFNEFLEAFRIVDSLGKDKTFSLKTKSNEEITELPDISGNLQT
ncbi:serine/threonine-protein phosphatase with EF-hands 2-like [Mercenaria mercenaria]|uniref:serine/threonine-protein phosphatase with EF-hands 2-like n=1 Tax=Mercenaria mercenaria TaxID=6596 RepID=UPI00234E4405|nr:serine/threonine-protein phosphatase with EF-hands 2-like [Mercenaria mercenaria]